MNQKDVEKYLRMVGEELQKQNQAGEIMLLGGAAMLISVGIRNITRVRCATSPGGASAPFSNTVTVDGNFCNITAYHLVSHKEAL